MTIEISLRALVAAGADMDVQAVYVAPYLGVQPETLHAVVDIPRAVPASTNGPKGERVADDGRRTVWTTWEGTAAVRWQGAGAGAAARRFVLAVLGNVVDDRALSIVLDLKGVAVETGEIERGDSYVQVASVAVGVAWDEALTHEPGVVESVTVGLSHDDVPGTVPPVGTPVAVAVG